MTRPHMSDAETWRPVPGFEGAYEVSDLGRVRSLDRMIDQSAKSGKVYTKLIKGKMLRPGRMKSGHLSVVLGRAAGSHCVHALVLLAFKGPPAPGQETRHLNGLEWDNRLVNLAYGTRSENTADKKDHKGTKNYILDTPKIKEIKAALKHPYPGIGRNLAERYGVAESTISAIKHGHLHALTS